MPLLQAKQLNINSVITSLTSYFNDPAAPNVTARNNFVNSIKGAPGFDEKVKADATDTDAPNYLSQKLIGDTTNPDVQINVAYSSTDKKVKISSVIDTDGLASSVAAKFIPIYFEATEEIATYTDLSLVNKHVIYIIREHSFLYQNLDEDGYQYDPITGTITFNTPVQAPERISMMIV